MKEQTPRLGKKGAAKKIAEKISKIRRAPLQQEVFDIVDRYNKKNQGKSSDKKSAKPPGELET